MALPTGALFAMLTAMVALPHASAVRDSFEFDGLMESDGSESDSRSQRSHGDHGDVQATAAARLFVCGAFEDKSGCPDDGASGTYSYDHIPSLHEKKEEACLDKCKANKAKCCEWDEKKESCSGKIYERGKNPDSLKRKKNKKAALCDNLEVRRPRRGHHHRTSEELEAALGQAAELSLFEAKSSFLQQDDEREAKSSFLQQDDEREEPELRGAAGPSERPSFVETKSGLAAAVSAANMEDQTRRR